MILKIISTTYKINKMNKKTKIALGVLFIAAGVGLYIWNVNKDKDDTACKSGEVPCPDNPNVCYNPQAKYKISPCSAISQNETGAVIGGETTESGTSIISK